MTELSIQSELLLADDVLPARIKDLAVPGKLNKLRPWHKPRKQWVREYQWMLHSRNLIRGELRRPGLSEQADGFREFKFLTLPGADYLDVRQLAEVCRKLNCCLTSTGFQSGGEGNPDVARVQVREKSLIDAGHITKYSHLFARRFEDIIAVKGSAYQELRRRAPFHIVNIDACGSIAAPTATHPHRLIEAIHRIVELQLELNKGRWLLFLTADARPGSIAQETLSKFCDAIVENAEVNDEFRDRASPMLSDGEPDIRIAARIASREEGDAFLRLFALGVAKWLLHLALEKRWDVKTHRPYCYSTMPAQVNVPSMACLAFEFLPPPPSLKDRFGISCAEPAPETNRPDSSLRAADRIGEMADLDLKLRENESLRSRMAENLRKLLEEAGYEPSALAEIGS